MESGSGESANKLVLESGLKEAEIPWARLHEWAAHRGLQ
jgi:hypothetical protein